MTDAGHALVGVLGRPAIGSGTGALLPVRGDRQAALLALLVATRGRALPREVIEDELWSGGHISPTAVRVNVGRLRRRFEEVTGADPITSDPTGYALVLDDDELDAGRFLAAVKMARAAWRRGDLGASIAAAAAGEALWRGPAYEAIHDVASIVPDRLRLDDARRDLRELHGAALLLTGDADTALDALTGEADDAHREAAGVLRLAALHAQGRRTEARRAFDAMVEVLCRDLGALPPPELVALRDLIEADASADEVVARALRAAGLPPTPDRAAVGPVARGIARESEPALVGRRAELAVVDDLIATASPRVWIVDGPAGVGKTRLADTATERAAARGLAVATATCPRGVGGGLRVLHQILTGILPAVDPGLLADPAVGGVLADALPDLARLLPEDTGRPTPAVTPAVAEARLFGALDPVVTACPPALVVVDDVQWIDDTVAGVLADLASRDDSTRWLLLSRGGDLAPAAAELLGALGRAGARFDTLHPLGEADARILVTATAPELPVAEVATVVERAGGNPFALIELARHSGSGGDLAMVPPSVDAVITAELDRLDPVAVRLAEAIAVAGRPHPLEVVLAAAAVPGRQAAAALGSLAANGLVDTDDRMARVWPRHDLVRAALTDRMLPTEVRRLHRELAGALEAADAGPILRLEHLFAAADAAAEEAEAAAAEVILGPTLLAAPRDVTVLGRALVEVAGPTGGTASQVATRLRIASAAFAIGDVAWAQHLLDLQQTALAELDDPVLDALALLTQSDVALPRDTAEHRWHEGERVLARLPPGPDHDDLYARLLVWTGHAAMRCGNTDRSDQLADLAAGQLEESSPDLLRFEITSLRVANAMAFTAPPGRIDDHLSELDAIVDAAGDPVLRPMGALAHVERAMRTGTLDEVTAEVDQVTRLATPGQRVEMRWWALATRAGLHLARGDLAAASVAYLDAMAFGAGHGVALATGTALIHRFELDTSLGRLDTFHALLPPPERDQDDTLLVAQALVREAAGDREGAIAAADLIAIEGRIATQGPGRWPVFAALAARAAWLLGHRRLGEVVAAELADRKEEGLNSIGLTYLGSLEHARGLASVAAGRVDEGIDQLHTGLERETWFGSPIWIARAARAAATAHERRARTGDGREAARLRRRAETAERPVVRPED